MKIRPLGAEVTTRTDVQTDRQIDMTKLKVAFRNFAKTVSERTITNNHQEES